MNIEEEIPKKRSTGPGKRFKSSEEFEAADNRDKDEPIEYGQQVKKCNYRSDIIVINEDEILVGHLQQYPDYIRSILYDDYVFLIEHIANGKLPNERRAKPKEALMTAAYVESRRSSCIKRKVGAIIATQW